MHRMYGLLPNKFKLTYGLRVDLPFYPYDPPKNPALEAVTFKDADGNDEHFDVSKWPDQKPLFSPVLVSLMIRKVISPSLSWWYRLVHWPYPLHLAGKSGR